MAPKVLVTGWFSFQDGEATAGDLLACDTACGWLEEAERDYDVALSSVFEGGVDWQAVNPEDYTDVLFVCGPAKGRQIEELTQRFTNCRLTGLDVSVVGTGENHLPFDELLERDGPERVRPDISFAARTERLPVAGLVLGHPQPEYGERGWHEATHNIIREAVYSRRLCVIPFDTRVDPTSKEFRSPAEVETLFSRVDLVVTTRMHGLVHALKNGVPALAVDPISGGAKVQRQAEAVGWPAVLTADTLTAARLHAALDFCLTSEARETAGACARRADEALRPLRERFIRIMRED